MVQYYPPKAMPKVLPLALTKRKKVPEVIILFFVPSPRLASFLICTIDRIQFIASVPFARFAVLKSTIEACGSWSTIDDTWSYFETQWKPESWNNKYRFVFTRKKVKTPQKGAIQLDLFEPVAREYQYKVIVTNKKESAKAVVLFHNGRGSQELLFGNAKNDTALSGIPCKSLNANQVFTVASMMAHNFSREMQMVAHPAAGRVKAKRPAAWTFKELDTIRHQIIQRAGRFIWPNGKLTLNTLQ